MNKLDTINELKKLGCKDNAKCAQAYQVINHLPSTGITVTEKKFLQDLGVIYLIGKDVDGKCCLYLPASSWQDLSLFDVDDIQSKLCNCSNMDFVLAVCDTSGTVLYYNMKSGWPS